VRPATPSAVLPPLPDRPKTSGRIVSVPAGSRLPAAALLGALALMPCLSGCAMIGAMAYKMSPDVTVPARYVPKKEPMVVIARTSQNAGGAALEAERLGRYVTEDLKDHKIGPMLDPSALTQFQSRRAGGSVWAAAVTTAPAARPMTLAELGRAVGAKQILYVDLTAFSVESALGTDMVKDPGRLVRAYDDAAGVTAEFDRNVLAVLNRELGADFDLSAFEHVAVWDAEHEWIEMRLRSLADQVVHVPALDLDVRFAAGEEMRTEVSAKFRRERVEAELAAAGLRMTSWWTDPDGDFGVSLAVPA